MNENTTNNAIVLNQDSTPEEYAAILKGRYVTNIGEYGTITLDNGTELDIDGRRMRRLRKWPVLARRNL